MTTVGYKRRSHVVLRCAPIWFAMNLLACSCLAQAEAGNEVSLWQWHMERADRLAFDDAESAQLEYQKAIDSAASPEDLSEARGALADLLWTTSPLDMEQVERLYRASLDGLASADESDRKQQAEAVTLYNLTVLLLDQDRPGEVLSLLSDAELSQMPENLRAQLFYVQGLATERLNRPHDALTSFLAAVAADPEHRIAIESAGRLVLSQPADRGREYATQSLDRLLAVGELFAAETLLLRVLQSWGPSRSLIVSLTRYLASARVPAQEFEQQWRPLLEGVEGLGVDTLEAIYSQELDPRARPEELPGIYAWRSRPDRRYLAALLKMLADKASLANQSSLAVARYTLAWRLDPELFKAFYQWVRHLGHAAHELDRGGRQLTVAATELEKLHQNDSLPDQSREIADGFLMLGLAAADQERPLATVAYLQKAAKLQRFLGIASPPVLYRRLSDAHQLLGNTALAGKSRLQATESYEQLRRYPTPTASQTNCYNDLHFLIIIHPNNPLTSLSDKHLTRIFLKQIRKWEGGQHILAIDQRGPIRESFTRNIHRRSVSSIQNFWQRQVFAGLDTPPLTLNNDTEVVKFVRRNPGAIGYVSVCAPLNGVKVIEVDPDSTTVLKKE